MDKSNKLHLACGRVSLSTWLNIDLDSTSADLLLDLTKPLPFVDNSVTHIFSEHFIEHITREQAVGFLVECRRLLKNGGTVRITTPNLRFLIATYLADNIHEWGDLWQPDTLCLMMNEGMRSWGHQFVYDADELVQVFLEAGFNSISFQDYRKSEDSELCELEDRSFHNELIIEAKKTDSPIPFIDLQRLNANEILWSSQLSVNFDAQYKANKSIIADQTNHIRGIETELSARALHIQSLEQTIGDQANHIRGIEAELSARALHIQGLEQTIGDQANHIRGIETELSARALHIQGLEQTIGVQANHIRGVDAELLKFRNSIYGKCMSGMQYLINAIIK